MVYATLNYYCITSRICSEVLKTYMDVYAAPYMCFLFFYIFTDNAICGSICP